MTALNALTSYIAAYGEVPEDPSVLVEHAAFTAKQLNPEDAETVIAVYMKNLRRYRATKDPAPNPSPHVSMIAHQCVLSTSLKRLLSDNDLTLPAHYDPLSSPIIAKGDPSHSTLTPPLIVDDASDYESENSSVYAADNGLDEEKENTQRDDDDEHENLLDEERSKMEEDQVEICCCCFIINI